jgi:drug/metabolite transporter (DMT)-like permease
VSPLHTWSAILAVVVASTAGDVLLAKAMKMVDLDEVRARRGLPGAVWAVLSNPWFLAGLGCMTAAFFALLVALSWDDVSLVAPASASLTFVASAVAGKLFLHERVDARRWAAALLVCAGVALLAV